MNTISGVEYGTPWTGSGAIPDAVNAIGQRSKATYTGIAYPGDTRLGANDYGYNSRGELVRASRKNTANSTVPFPHEQFEYDFDGIGNRNTAGDGTTEHSYVPNALNQYEEIDSVGISYDLDGNLADDGNMLYVWDAENRLIEVKQGTTTIATYVLRAELMSYGNA